jgi:SdrD B-like domain
VKRALIVLVALVATPFLVGAAQGQGHDAAHCAKRAAQHPGKDINKCDAPPTPPSPPPAPTSSCVASAPGSGSSRIDGTVYNDNTTRPGLVGWCVELTGTVTATAVTDASGNYAFTGLPDGTYTICEDLQQGWTETFPQSSWGTPCPGGFGWSFSLSGGTGAGWVNFGNVQP